jgi:hypothetical protein
VIDGLRTSITSPVWSRTWRANRGQRRARAGPAIADDEATEPQIVILPIECMDFWSVPGGPQSPAAWNAMLSFAACIQDASVYRVERAELLPGFVDQLQAALAPSIQFYVVAIKEAPEHVKLRAAYAIALGQVAMMTRARASLAIPQLRDQLEQLLDPHAKLAYLIFAGIDQAATADPELDSDAARRERDCRGRCTS